MITPTELKEIAQHNVRAFTLFRMFFSARFYYPVYALIFFDHGLTLEQFGFLNAIWAATIVLFEVPSGALADTLGRKKLLVIASICMVLGMFVLLIAPVDGGSLTLTLFVWNRILSGIAEAAASGADEALAYDSLKAAGEEDRWGQLLEKVQRMTSIAFFFTMMTGSAIYDAKWVNAVLKFLAVDFSVDKGQLMKLPILLTFCSFFVVLATALRMRETLVKTDVGLGATLANTWKQTLQASKWVWMNIFALGVILASVVLISVILHLLTLTSEYWTVIDLPVASYGMIGSGMSIMGFFTPIIARRLTENFKPGVNFLIVCTGVWIGLYGLSMAIPYWGILPATLLYAGIQFTTYMVSRYLNEIAPSEQRATILSLRGFSTNLVYGAVSLIYGVLIACIKSGYSEEMLASDSEIKDAIFVESLGWFPWYFLLSVVVCILIIRLRAAFLKNGSAKHSFI